MTDLIKWWCSDRSFVNCNILNWLNDTINVTNMKNWSPQNWKTWSALWYHLLSATFYFQLKDTIKKNRSAQMWKTWLSGLSLIICHLQTEKMTTKHMAPVQESTTSEKLEDSVFFTLGYSFWFLPTEIASDQGRGIRSLGHLYSVCVLDKYNTYI